MREGVGRGRASAPSFLVVRFPLLQSGTTCASALHSMPFSFYAEGHVRPPGCHPVFFKCLQLSPAPFPVHGKRMPVPFGRSGYVCYSSLAVLYGRISLPFACFVPIPVLLYVFGISFSMNHPISLRKEHLCR